MTYMYCPACKKIANAVLTGTREVQLTCSICGSTLKTSRCIQETCADCSSTLYAPKGLDFLPPCPCRSAARKREDPPGQTTASAPVVIRCPTDDAELPFSDGCYGACPLCGKTPSEIYISQQTYLKGKAHKPIQIKWDPKPDELLYMHHHSSHIPPDSLLIVNPNQVAAYTSGGQMAVLKAGQTYALFNAAADTGAVARAVNDGSLSTQPLFLNLNTKVIFVDNRTHDVDMTVSMTLPGGSWNIELPLSLRLSIDGTLATTLLRNALDFADSASVSNYLIGRAKTFAREELLLALAGTPAEAVLEADSADQIRKLLAGILDRRTAALKDSVNAKIHAQWGLVLESIDLFPFKAVCTSNRKTELLKLNVNATLPGGSWSVELPAQLHLTHMHAHGGADPAQLLRMALSSAHNALLSSLAELASSEVSRAQDDTQLQSLLSRWSAAQKDAVASSIQKALPQGLALNSFEVFPFKAVCVSNDQTELVECPFPYFDPSKQDYDESRKCGAKNRIPKGSKAPFKCKACGETIRWCSHCQKFTSDYVSILICDKCNIRIR